MSHTPAPPPAAAAAGPKQPTPQQQLLYAMIQLEEAETLVQTLRERCVALGVEAANWRGAAQAASKQVEHLAERVAALEPDADNVPAEDESVPADEAT